MYEKNIKMLDQLRTKNPMLVDQELEVLVDKLKYKINKQKAYQENLVVSYPTNNEEHLFKSNINSEFAFQFVIYIIMILFSTMMLLPNNIENISLFIFGIVFFIAGFNVATGKDTKGFGLIFLFSHGMTGYGIMIGSLIGGRINEAILSDIGGNTNFYLLLTISVILIAVIGTIIYNLNDAWKNEMRYKLIILLLYAVGIGLVGYLPLFNY